MICPKQLKHLVENTDLVKANYSERYPELRVVKYKNKVFYNNLWNEHPLLVECRGLVIDDQYNVVVKPFTKTFNRFENSTNLPPNELVTWVEKVNGFLGVLTNYKDKIIVSTTGSLDSKYVDLAATYIERYGKLLNSGQTALFEIVDPNDPHIIREKKGAYLIGLNDNGYWHTENRLDKFCGEKGLGDYRPFWGRCLFSEVVESTKQVEHEGFMVYSDTQNLKLKSPYYLTQKLFARMKSEKLEKILESDQPLRVDEDYLPVVQYLRDNFHVFKLLNEQLKITYIRDFIEREILK